MESLPEAAADFLYSSEMSEIIKTIANKHTLHIDQMGLLEAETGQLILGLTEPQEFASYIAESIKISAEQAIAITKDINEQIISKIRTSMGQPSGIHLSNSVPPLSKFDPIAPVHTGGIPASSVVMPSSSKTDTPPVLSPTMPPVAAPTPVSTPSLTPKPGAIPNLAAADALLSEKKVVPPPPVPISTTPGAPAASPAPKNDPTQPQNYKADPYREPVE